MQKRWHNKLPYPFTGFPSGTNWPDYNISANVLSMDKVNDNTVSIYGLIPCWDPNHWIKNYSMVICMCLGYGETPKWMLSMNSAPVQTYLFKQDINMTKMGVPETWNYLELGFDDGYVQGMIGLSKDEIKLVSDRYKLADYVRKNNAIFFSISFQIRMTV